MNNDVKVKGWIGRRWALALLTLVGGLTLALALFASPARADTFTVNSTDDGGDASFLPDGTCDADLVTPGNQCTLRAAIEEANVNGEADNINFDLLPNSTIELTSGTQLTITTNIEIVGPGADTLTVDGITGDGTNNRVFGIGSAGDATVKGLTVTGGNGNDEGGGAIFNDGGTLKLNNSTVSGNSADFDGGGVFSVGTLTVTGSTVSGNSATYGGGIANDGTLTVKSSTISGNSADSVGGGISSTTDSVSGTTPNPTEETTVTNSTISGNISGIGGGVYNANGLTLIENTTVTGNTSAPDGQGAGVASYGDAFARTEVLASIISANDTTDVDFVSGSSNSFQSNGSNLIGDGNATGNFNKAGDRTGVTAPKLGALANNGGPTKTHAVLSGSPALDAVVGACGVATDQRGVARPQDGDNNGSAICDKGAFELKAAVVQPPPPTTNPPAPKPPVTNPKPPSTYNPNACTIKGNNRSNVLRGTPRRDVICGFGGNDIIRGLGGNDLIKGGAGHDVILGGRGNDRIFGQGGNDILYGQAGNDRLVGGGGNDALFGGNGRDVLLGQRGNDALLGGGGRDVENGGPGRDSTNAPSARKLVKNIFRQVGLR